MYSQLFDDEWSEAFEALKPNMKKEEEVDDEDELYPNILTKLHSILEASLCTLTLRCREYMMQFMRQGLIYLFNMMILSL